MYAIYTRQSVEREESTSIDAQIEYCANQIKQQTGVLGDLDESVYKVYSDRGYSGKNTDRPNFAAMMRDIEEGQITHVVVYKLDRISRSVIDFANISDKFTKHKVEFISCHEKFDTTSPTGRAMLQITIVFAQLERETIQQRVADTYRSRSRQGFYMGGRVPYGFTLEKIQIDGKSTSRYVINEDEAQHIRLLYDMYSADNSLGDIVRHLRDNGIEHLRGAIWSSPRISEILRNPSYVKADIDVYNFYKSQGANIINDVSDFIGENGCYLYSATGVSSHRKQYDLADRDLVIAPHQGIVSPDAWLRCRIKCMNNRQSSMTCKGKNTWLVGKMKCASCGYALTIRKSNTRAHRYFICSSMSTSKGCDGAGKLYASEVEDKVLDNIKIKLSEFNSLSKSGVRPINPEINQLKVQIAQIEKDIDNWVKQAEHADGALLKRINEKVAGLDSQRKIIEQKLFLLDYDTPINDIDQITAFVDKWDTIDFEDKKRVVDAIIKIIYIGDSILNIEWKL